MPCLAGRRFGTVLIVSVLLEIVYGLTEEILWRAIYVAVLADNQWRNSVYPLPILWKVVATEAGPLNEEDLIRTARYTQPASQWP